MCDWLAGFGCNPSAIGIIVLTLRRQTLMPPADAIRSHGLAAERIHPNTTVLVLAKES